ncbi:hypothetical protein F4604DRAFT_1692156 [Suillus subluteus]|nr:hypothetical protein F4604DRAFT_1692156 [Suillus subluteus]
MVSNSHLQVRRKAKDLVLENPVWQPLEARSKQSHKHELSTSGKVSPDHSDQAKSGKDSEDSEEAQMSRWQQSKKVRKSAIDIKSEPESDASMSKSAEDLESETEPAESVAKGLSGEVSTYNTVFGTYLAFTLLDSYNGLPEEALPGPNSSYITIPKGNEHVTVIKDSSSTRLGVTTEAMNARERKHAAECPTSRVKKTSRTCSEESILLEDKAKDSDNSNVGSLNIKSEAHSNAESKAESHESSLHVLDPTARIVYTKTGSVRLTDQNIELRKVIQRGILEVKAYIAFEHGYPDLVTKNIYTRDILLKAAQYHTAVPIEKRMQTDDEYLLALTNLIDARASLFRSDIKEVTIVVVLTNHIVQGCWPPFTELTETCSQRFYNIVKNKGWPPGDSNPHVGHSLHCISKRKAPIKFHKMMSDIYEEVNRFRHSISGAYNQDDSLSFLDLDSMDDE